MTLGPIEVVVLGFPGSRFTGEIRPRIEELIERGIVNVVDAVLITKNEAGDVTLVEMQQQTDDPDVDVLSALMSDHLDLIADDDVQFFAQDLQPGSSALALAFEHVWMKPVREAIIASGGVLLADIHVPADVVDEVLAAVELV